MNRSTFALLLGSIWAASAAACGPEGGASTPVPPIDVLEVTAISARNVRIRWSPKSLGNVRIERATKAGMFERVGSKPASHGRFLDLALEPQTTYRYRLAHCLSETTCSETVQVEPVTTSQSSISGVDVEIDANGTEDNLVLFGVATLDADLLDMARMVAIDREGTIVWEYTKRATMLAPVTEVHLLDNGTLATGHNASFLQMDLDGTELYRYRGGTAHHDIDPISGGGFIFLTFDVFSNEPGDPILGDGIEIVQAGAQYPSWTWLARDHISLAEREPLDWANTLLGIGHDWTHANALTFDEEAGRIYVNVRNLNRLYCIDYPSGDVLWSMGDGGDFGHGLWAHSHDPTFTAPNRFLMFDNGTLRPGATEFSRIIEVDFDPVQKRADIVWEYRESPDFFAFAQGAVSVEPNGNIFVTDGVKGRLFELTREKEPVWQVRLPYGTWTYKAITVPRKVFLDW